MAGYAEMGKNDNSAGWILTTLAYSLGGRMETGTGKDAKATLDNPQTVAALNALKTMRWTDNSMGATQDYGWSDINQAFVAGKVGMYVSGSDVYTNLVQSANLDPKMYGLTTIPVGTSAQAAVLGGGTLAAVKPDANPDEIAAAVKWIDFFYEQPLVNEQQASTQCENPDRFQAARRCSGPAGLRQGAVRPGQHLDQAVHQCAGRADDRLHGQHLQPDARRRAGGLDPERLPLTGSGGAGRPDQQERRRQPAALGRQ